MSVVEGSPRARAPIDKPNLFQMSSKSSRRLLFHHSWLFHFILYSSCVFFLKICISQTASVSADSCTFFLFCPKIRKNTNLKTGTTLTKIPRVSTWQPTVSHLWNVPSASVVVPSNWHPLPPRHSFHTVIQLMGPRCWYEPRWHMKARGDESTWEAFLEPTSAVHGCFLAVFCWVRSPTVWRWEPMTERKRERERGEEKEPSGDDSLT